jgi:hypothetical protein
MLIIVAIPALFLSIFLEMGLTHNCELSGTPAWSQQLKYVIGGCDNQFVSPNGKLLLRINREGKISLIDKVSGNIIPIHANAVEPPAMASWAPKSDAFFINDGEGSGMASVFHLFKIKPSQVAEDSTIQTKLVALYRSQNKCSANTADPNVWGIGWSHDGTRIHFLVQTTANDACGEPGSFAVITVNRADGSILEEFTEEAAKRKFQSLLPTEVYSK